ncbi:hypothetical protein HMPREF9057_00327 [Actinomyces sp. oral taxon 171 str. F0337]|nr:hypothetical protein HMPREF9057_00327 [Actinomyces sp. oral taxon 171 str. F0337]
MPRGLRTAHQEWPRGPGLWRRWTGAGSDGGWCTSVRGFPQGGFKVWWWGRVSG